jgi:hypothetical protein
MADRPEPYTWADQISYAAESVLDAAKEALFTHNRVVPAVVYATEGTPVHDGEQLTISLVQSYYGQPGDQAEQPSLCNGIISAVFQLELVRCVASSYNLKTKTGGTVEEKHESALELYKDASTLIRTPNYLPHNFDRTTMADITIGTLQGGYIPITMNVIVGLVI